MARKPEYIGILQADPHRLSYLRAQHSAQGIIVAGHYIRQGNWSLETGSLADALKEFAEEHQIAGDEVYSVLPRHEITCRILSFPSHDDAELRSMVQLSAEEYVPFAADEIIVDQAVLQRHPGGESDLLAAFAHKDLVQHHLTLLRQAGIEPRQILLSTACVASAALHVASDQERVAVVELGASGFEVAIFQGRQLRHTRGLAGAHDWTVTLATPGSAMDELAIELRSSLSTYRRESVDGIAIEDIYLSGEVAAFEDVASLVASETAKNCTPAPFPRMLLEGGAEHLKGVPLVALGAVLAARQQAPVRVGLLPADVEQQRALLGAQNRLVKAAVLGALVIAALGALYFQSVFQRNQLIRELQAQRDAIAPMAEGVAEKQAQLRTIREQVEAQGSVLELLATIAEAAPDGAVNVSRFVYEREEGIDLWGRAKTIDDVHRFSQSIRSLATGHLSLLANAVRVYENRGSELNQEIFDYQLSIPFPEEDDDTSTQNVQ